MTDDNDKGPTEPADEAKPIGRGDGWTGGLTDGRTINRMEGCTVPFPFVFCIFVI